MNRWQKNAKTAEDVRSRINDSEQSDSSSPSYSQHLGVCVYPREAVLTIQQVADALQLSCRTVERLDIPCAYLGSRTRRYIWGSVLDFLKKRQV